jgi:hypothetical protein
MLYLSAKKFLAHNLDASSISWELRIMLLPMYLSNTHCSRRFVENVKLFFIFMHGELAHGPRLRQPILRQTFLRRALTGVLNGN